MKTKGIILLLRKTSSSQRRKSSGNKPSSMDSFVFLAHENGRAKSKKARNAKISHELRQILGGQAAAAMKKPKPPPKSRLLKVGYSDVRLLVVSSKTDTPHAGCIERAERG